MIKVSGTDNGKGVWMDVVGLTDKGRREIARIPRKTMERLVRVNDGEMGCVSVDVLRDIGENAGFYHRTEGCERGMWVEPREAGREVPHEEDNPTLYRARLIEMYYKSGVRVDMRALRGVLDVAAIVGGDRYHLMAKNGYWMLVNKEDRHVVVKERDDALGTAYRALGIGDVRFEVADVERVWEDVVAPPFDAPEWDINGNGRLCLWMDEDGFARLRDVSGGGEIAHGMKADGSTAPRLLYAKPVALWMEKYEVWKEAVKATRGEMFWNAKPGADVVFIDGRLELGLRG